MIAVILIFWFIFPLFQRRIQSSQEMSSSYHLVIAANHCETDSMAGKHKTYPSTLFIRAATTIDRDGGIVYPLPRMPGYSPYSGPEEISILNAPIPGCLEIDIRSILSTTLDSITGPTAFWRKYSQRRMDGMELLELDYRKL
jgi:hypothetical protein